MAYNTGNAIGSTDARDLYDNAQNLDKAMNSTDPTWIDRFGVARPTFKGAESELNQKVGDAEAAATQALGYLNTMRATSYGPLAEDPTTDQLGNPCTAGDEYFNTTYNLLKRFDGSIWRAPDINTENLASGAGSSMVGHGGQTVEAALNERLPEIGTYALLRSYTGPVTAFMVRCVENTFDGGAGVFRVKSGDTTSADNGGTILVDAIGRRWFREFSGAVNVRWFGAKGDGVADDTTAIQAALDYAVTLASQYFQPSGVLVNSNDPAVNVEFPPGKYKVSAQLVVNATRIRLYGEHALIWTGTNGVIPSSYLIKFNMGFDTVIDGLALGSTETGCIEFDCPNISSAMVKITNCSFIGNVSSGNAVGTAIKYTNQSSCLIVENCKFRDIKHPIENILGDMVRFTNCWFDNNYPKTYSDDSGYFNNIFGYFTVEDCIFAGGPGNKGTRVAYFNCDRDIQLTIRRCRVAFEDGGGPLINWKAPIALTNGSFWRNGFLVDDITTAPRGQNETYYNRTATPLVRLYQMPNRMVFKNISWVNTIQALIGVAPTTTLETLYQAAIAQDRRYSQLAYRYEDSVGNEMYLVPTTDKIVHKKWMRLFNICNYSFEVESPGNAVTHYVHTFFTDAELNAGLFEVSAFMTTGADRRKSQQWVVTTRLDPTAATRSFTTTIIAGGEAVDGQNITLAPKFREISTGTYTDTIPFEASTASYELAFELTRVGPNTFNFPEFFVRPMRGFNVASPTTGTPRQFFAPSA